MTEPAQLSPSSKLSQPSQPAQPSQPFLGPQLLAELMKNNPAQDVEPQPVPSPRAVAKSSGPGLIGLVIVIVAVTIAIRVFFDARNDGNWVRVVGPLVFIAIAVHGWWRARRRRDVTMDGSGTTRKQ
jgi:FtsZ-interacting cell division protein ZipA